MPSDEQKPLLRGQLRRQRLIKDPSLRAEQYPFCRPRILGFCGLHGIEHRLAHHDHPRPPAKRLVIHGLVRIGGKVPDICCVVLYQSLLRRPFGNAGSQHGSEHFRKQRDDVKPQRHDLPPRSTSENNSSFGRHGLVYLSGHAPLTNPPRGKPHLTPSSLRPSFRPPRAQALACRAWVTSIACGPTRSSSAATKPSLRESLRGRANTCIGPVLR